MAHVKVTGLVDKPLGNHGFIMVETINTRDFQMERRWKVWNADNVPAFGSTVEVVGEFSAKIAKKIDSTEDYITPQGNRMIDYNINESKVTITAAPVVASPDVNGDWATPPTQVAPF
jgi:hypothetical protein